ncbi:MAG TPA: CoA-transferase [Burkholderiaceae bacterium]|jgi:glutaconate CoA-transferase, subunit A|nr:CoA-transferase [Burkholderiaceae bacterium]
MSDSSGRRSRLINVGEAADRIRDGMTIAIGGFINAGHPMPIVRELIRRGVRDLTVVGPASGGLDLDLLVAAGCVRQLVSCYFGAETLAPIAPMIRRASERAEVDIFECDEGMYYAALRAGAQRLPFLPTRAGVGTSYPEVNRQLKVFSDPVRGEPLLAVPAIRPEIALLYVAASDVFGNAQHAGTGYGDRALYRAADCTIVFAERIVSNEEIRRDPAKTSIPGADAVVRAPYGAHPFASAGCYRIDEDHLREYLSACDALARDGERAPLEAYLQRYVHEPRDHVEYLEAVGLRRLLALAEH